MTARIAILFLFCRLCAPMHAQSDDFAIDWFSLDCGGGTSADDVYAVSGTIGQPDAGEVGDAVFAVAGGFWEAAFLSETTIAPTLTIRLSGNNIILSWSADATGFFLEQNDDVTQPAGWHPVGQPLVVNGQNIITVPASGGMAYYRLTDTPAPGTPRLIIARSGANVLLSWPAWATGYYLEQNLDLTKPAGWWLVNLPVLVSNGLNTVTVPATHGMAFFRLTQTPSTFGLMITRAGTNVILSWPASATGYYLEQNLSATQPGGWSLVGTPVVVTDGLNTVTVSASDGMKFFRLTTNPSPPQLTIKLSGANAIFSWPASATGYYLEQTTDLTRASGWSLVGTPVAVTDGLNTITVPASDGMKFFRLTTNPSPPRLTIKLSGANAILSWPASATGYYLEQTTDLTRASGWSLVGLPILASNGVNSVTVPLSGSMTFYRLTQTPNGPLLRIATTGMNTVVISWPEPSSGFSLQQNVALGTTNWLGLTNVPVIVGNRNQVVLPVSDGRAFFRLRGL